MTAKYRATLHDRIYYCDYLLERASLLPPSDEERADAIDFLNDLRSEYRHALHELSLRKN
jgi:hypothetical protein